MANITAKDRIEATFRGEYLDRVPLVINCTRSDYIIEKSGYSRMEILTEPDKDLEALQLSQEEFPSDIIRVPADPLLSDAIAARLELKKGPNAPSGGRMLEDKANLEGMKFRDPRENKTYRPYLDMVSRVKDMFPDHPAMAMAPGVWSNAAELRGPETFILDTVDDPDFVHNLLRFMTDVAKARGEALSEMGTDMVIFGDPSAGCSRHASIQQPTTGHATFFAARHAPRVGARRPCGGVGGGWGHCPVRWTGRHAATAIGRPSGCQVRYR